MNAPIQWTDKILYIEDRIYGIIPVRIEDIFKVILKDYSDDYFGNKNYYIEAGIIMGNEYKILSTARMEDYRLFSNVGEFFLEQRFFPVSFYGYSDENNLFNSEFDYRQSPDNENWLEIRKRDCHPVVFHLTENDVCRILSEKNKFDKKQNH